MHRDALADLRSWHTSSDRLPLVVRGARQVGKTWLVREFARTAGLDLLELNLERHPEDASLIEDRDPKATLRRLEARSGRRIVADDAILFLDEVQAVPSLFARLRWFAEDLPELSVVAAGSLLDLALKDAAFSVPVGRLRYLHLEPLSFTEFLRGIGEPALAEYVATWSWREEVPDSLWVRLGGAFRDYVLVGGMPAAVSTWIRTGSILDVSEVHQRLVTAFREDFHKYGPRSRPDRLRMVFDAVPRLLGRKFVLARVGDEVRSRDVRDALELLFRARVATRVSATQGTGVPLGAEIRDRAFKVVFLDTGLASSALGLSFENFADVGDLELVNGGAVVEQAMGQILRGVEPRFMEPALYYWTREKAGSSAEIDYLLQHGATVVPVEVKAGKTGTLKSLHLFMAKRGLPRAVRFNADLPSLVEVDARTTTGERARYRLLSLPFFFAEQVHRLLRADGP